MRESVLLVAMPFLSVARPALGVSAIRAALTQRGISARVLYANVRFADVMGVRAAEHIAEVLPTNLLIGDWIFARTDAPPRGVSGSVLADVLHARTLAPAFIEDIAHEIVARAPRIVGFSSTFQQNVASLRVAERVRALDPSITICFGGANCEGPMGRALLDSFPFVDVVFSGEADHTFPEFASRLLAGVQPYSSDPSVYTRSEPATGAEVSPVLDLDTLPIPDFSDYFDELGRASYRDSVRPAVLFETSRGCWWGAKHHCAFCGLNGSSLTYRSKSPARVLAEVHHHLERYGITRFDAADNILNLKFVEHVFTPLAEEGAACSFFYEIKSNMTVDQLERMARGGVTWVQPGIESLDDHVLALMNKGVTALQNVRLLRTCRELGVGVVWNILCGFPGESDMHYARMAAFLPLLEHLDPPNSCSRIRLDRFSPYFQRAAEVGFRDVAPAAAYRDVYDLPDATLHDLAYFFDGAADAASEAQIRVMRDRIRDWRARDAGGGAVLEAHAIPGGLLVVDTRSCARDRYTLLDAVAVDLLDALREPQPLAAALARVQAMHGDAADEALQLLRDCGFILEVEERALGLVTRAGREVHSPARRADLPWGWVAHAEESEPAFAGGS